MVAVEARPVRGAGDRRAFLAVPTRVFSDDPAWIPALRRDERCKISPASHPFFAHGTAEFWVAWRGKTPLGRISAQVNDLANRDGQSVTAHFGMLDATDSTEVFAALISAAADWARARGCAALEGPYSLSLNEEFGVLVDGFDSLPVVMMAHTRPYYLTQLQRLGFSKAKDFLHMAVPATPETLTKARNLFGRIRAPEGCAIRVSSKPSLRRDFHLGMRIYNDAWRKQWGFLPVTDEEVDFLAKRLAFIFDPNLLLLAEHNGRPVGLCCCIPDYNEAIRDLHGRLLPFGWLKFAARLALRRVKRARLILIGTASRYHKTPFGAYLHLAMLARMIEYLLKRGFTSLELAWIIEDNRDMLKLAAHFDALHRKTYRILTRPL